MSKELDEKLKEAIIYFKQAPITAITIEQTISEIKAAILAEIPAKFNEPTKDQVAYGYNQAIREITEKLSQP